MKKKFIIKSWYWNFKFPFLHRFIWYTDIRETQNIINTLYNQIIDQKNLESKSRMYDDFYD